MQAQSPSLDSRKSPKSKGITSPRRRFWAITALQLRNRLQVDMFRSRRNLVLSLLVGSAKFLGSLILSWIVLAILVNFQLITLYDSFDFKVVVFLMFLIVAFALIDGLVGLTKSLYFADDNKVLLTMPIKANQVFVSKMIVHFVTTLKKNFIFFMPIMIATGIINNFNVAYYLMLVPNFLLLSLLLVVVNAVLSVPTMLISMLLRTYNTLRYIVYAAVVSVSVYIVYQIIASIPANFNLIQQFTQYYYALQAFFESFKNTMWFLAEITRMFTGEFGYFSQTIFSLHNLYITLVVIGLIALLGTLVYFVSRPIFHKMASVPFEYKRRLGRQGQRNKYRIPILSSIVKELKISARTPDVFAGDFGIVIILPLVMFLLNKVFQAMTLSVRGVALATAFNMLLMLIICLSLNVSLASSLSREGAAFYHLRTSPQDIKQKIISKLAIKICSSTIAIIASAILNTQYFGSVATLTGALLAIIVICITIGHALWCVQLDIAHPKWRQYNNNQTFSSNSNEIKAYGIGFVLSLIISVVSVKLILEGIEFGLVKIMIFAIGFVILRIVLMAIRASVGYRELMENST